MKNIRVNGVYKNNNLVGKSYKIKKFHKASFIIIEHGEIVQAGNNRNYTNSHNIENMNNPNWKEVGKTLSYFNKHAKDLYSDMLKNLSYDSKSYQLIASNNKSKIKML